MRENLATRLPWARMSKEERTAFVFGRVPNPYLPIPGTPLPLGPVVMSADIARMIWQLHASDLAPLTFEGATEATPVGEAARAGLNQGLRRLTSAVSAVLGLSPARSDLAISPLNTNMPYDSSDALRCVPIMPTRSPKFTTPNLRRLVPSSKGKGTPPSYHPTACHVVACAQRQPSLISLLAQGDDEPYIPGIMERGEIYAELPDAETAT